MGLVAGYAPKVVPGCQQAILLVQGQGRTGVFDNVTIEDFNSCVTGQRCN